MSKKIELSDDFLDSVSGGVFTYKGQDVTKFEKVSGHGVEVHTSEGLLYFPWNDKAREEFPGMFGSVAGGRLVVSKSATFDRFKLEEYTGEPRPVE